MQAAWFETFFQGPAVEFWIRAMPPALTILEVEFLEKTLAAGGGSRLLDIPCGNGRHSMELARRGYRITAVDLSREFLDAGRRAAAEARVEIDWRHGDMRALDLPEAAFDGAFCMGNSFGYLDAANARAFLGSVAKALRPGGRLAVDTGVAAESILPSLRAKWWHRFGDLVVLSECRYAAEDSRLDIDYTFIQGIAQETRPTSSYVVTVAELRRMLDGAGFDVIAIQGGFAGEPFQLGSRLVLTAALRTPV